MSSILTSEDLAAIKQLIDASVDERVPKIINELVPKIIEERVPEIIDEKVPNMINAQVQPMFDALESRLTQRIDDLDDTLSRQTADGFAEVHARIDALQQIVARIETVQRNEVARADKQVQLMRNLRETLHSV